MQAETVEGVADRGWLIVEAVLDVIEQLASVDPVVLAVEDLHWADQSIDAAGGALHRAANQRPQAGAAVHHEAGTASTRSTSGDRLVVAWRRPRRARSPSPASG